MLNAICLGLCMVHATFISDTPALQSDPGLQNKIRRTVIATDRGPRDTACDHRLEHLFQFSLIYHHSSTYTLYKLSGCSAIGRELSVEQRRKLTGEPYKDHRDNDTDKNLWQFRNISDEILSFAAK